MIRWPSALLLHRDRHVTIRGQTDLVALDVSDHAAVDEMMVALVASLAAVLLRQLDAFAFNTVDGPDMGAVRSNDFHVLFDFVDAWHCSLLRFAGGTRG